MATLKHVSVAFVIKIASCSTRDTLYRKTDVVQETTPKDNIQHVKRSKGLTLTLGLPHLLLNPSH